MEEEEEDHLEDLGDLEALLAVDIVTLIYHAPQVVPPSIYTSRKLSLWMPFFFSFTTNVPSQVQGHTE